MSTRCGGNYLLCPIRKRTECPNRDACYTTMSGAVRSLDTRLLPRKTRKEYAEEKHKG